MRKTRSVDSLIDQGSRANAEEAGARASIDRRSFLQRAGAAALGVGVMGLGKSSLAEPQSAQPPSIKRYVKLGKTGLKISDIGFGSGGCKSPDLVRHCYDRGINYFDTAAMYRSKGLWTGDYIEKLIGDALRDKRDKVVITTKCTAKADDDRRKIMSKLEASLRRLQTDYVDIYLNHAVNDPERLKNQEWFEFVELAKKHGKIRFSGMSGHGGRLQECLEYALDHELVDVVLVAHSFGSDPAFYEKYAKYFDIVANQEGLPRLIKKAHDKGVGVIAMKTLMGAGLNDMRPYQWGGASIPRAAFRWVFSDPNVDALVISMNNPALADSYIACSGERTLQKSDKRTLERFVRANTRSYCRNNCCACGTSCPHGVPIADVLRQRMYALRYGYMDLARDGYATLQGNSTACLSCAKSSCAAACPYDLDVPELVRETTELLSRG
jgi:predicted aldo/keto reductase-like oxidoreductase